LKVLIYTHGFAPQIGGAETYAMLLAQGLAQNSDSPSGGPISDVTVITPTPRGDFDDSKLPFRVVRRPRVVTVIGLIRKADVVQLAGPCLLPLLFGLLMQKTVVIEHHGYQACCPNGLLFYEPTKTACSGHFMARRYTECLRCNASAVGWFKSALMLLLTFPRRQLCKHATANIPITRHVESRLQMPNSHVIYYGIPHPPHQPASTATNPVTSSPPCFAYVGRLVSEKGLSLMVAAAARLKADAFEFQLKFIGDGPERHKLEASISSLGLDERVRFTGYLSGDNLLRAMEDVTAFLMPSIWEETAGLSAIEQMMKGRLVIASDIGGLGEIVNGAGLKFPAGDLEGLVDCMRRVLEYPEVVKHLGPRARERASHLFAQDRMVREYCDVYIGLRKSSFKGNP
jgi:glycogen(starch) synthase